jgi:ubiquitin carboxyl-terminal hydrolase 5/13
MQRYELGDDWQPHKIEVDIDVPEEISLQGLKGTGPQEAEILVPDEPEGSSESATVQNAPAVDENSLAQLMDMGFSMNGSKRALMAVGGSDVEAAMNWVFEHNSDPDFNDPLPDGDVAASVVSSDVDEGVVMSLVENLGCFTGDQVRAALKHCGGASDRAADWLFSHMVRLTHRYFLNIFHQSLSIIHSLFRTISTRLLHPWGSMHHQMPQTTGPRKFPNHWMTVTANTL